MNRKIMISAGIAALAAAIAGTAIALGSPAQPPPRHHAPVTHVAVAPMAPAKVCADLTGSPKPLVTYALRVIQQTVDVSGLTPSAADARKAKAEVAQRVRESCPQFAYLIAQYASTR